MALHLDLLGKTLDPIAFRYTPDQAILYALGIGAGVDELDFVYEKNLKVFPTFATTVFLPIFFDTLVPRLGIDLFQLLHGEHRLVLHKPIPTRATLHTTTHCDAIYDKGDKGAVLHLRFVTRDASGEPVFENLAVFVDRAAGNFGGQRGPASVLIEPPAQREPDFLVSETIAGNQAALHRLSGDRNPLHIEPAFARQAGFARPILHGLCTFGYAGRAILHRACHSDPARLASFGVRFMHGVYPGDTLTTAGWRQGDGSFAIRTTNQEGKIVLGNALATIR